MDDLTLILSHHKTTSSSRKQVVHEDDEKADALACIISFNNSQQYSAMCNINHHNFEPLLVPKEEMDKASILEGAATLIRQLRDHQKVETVQHHHLETTTNNEKEEAPAVLKKARNYENQSSIDMMMKSSLPQVEVRSLEEEMLITIYCKKQQKGNIDKILSVIRKLHLTIKSCNFMPFGSTTMHITVIAQMNDEFCETTNYLAEKLRQSIIKI
ncbi:hypothetical protein K7X08_011269 [Anisodus acutangulus]|uniref:Plant bHLH transcription factor ACT-like domain-containing protein n=1 Tax=Anisodus acutangulus TaxID=402998 RepID=A0A9Q1R8K6_9SOLA|nr:hypothetical protein K7X08_011269 [Anisodus acutangulus]